MLTSRVKRAFTAADTVLIRARVCLRNAVPLTLKVMYTSMYPLAMISRPTESVRTNFAVLPGAMSSIASPSRVSDGDRRTSVIAAVPTFVNVTVNSALPGSASSLGLKRAAASTGPSAYAHRPACRIHASISIQRIRFHAHLFVIAPPRLQKSIFILSEIPRPVKNKRRIATIQRQENRARAQNIPMKNPFSEVFP